MNRLKIYKIVLACLILSIIVVGSAIITKYIKEYKNEKATKQVLTNINEKFNNDELENKNLDDNNANQIIKEIDEKINGHKVVGIINIPEVNLKYPILETTTEETLNLSITKFWGKEINEIGNVTLAGHNNLSGVMFGKIKNLKIGDVIELTDIQNVTLKYEIFKTYVIDPNDISCILPENESTREVTLITCTKGGNNRYIVKAREIEN